VESSVRRITNGSYFDVLYLSSLEGNFQTGELITDTTGVLAGSPQIIGSLNNVLLTDGGQNNNIGDVFSIYSTNGKQGQARVTATTNGTGRVNFQLQDGGSGYTANADAVVATQMFQLSGVNGSGFQIYETVIQPQATITYQAANGLFNVGETVVGYTSGTWLQQANGIVISAANSAAGGNVQVLVTSGDFRYADICMNAGNTVGGLIDTVANTSATANVVGSNATYIGVFDTNNSFVVNSSIGYIQGVTSGTTANLASKGTGSGASFSIGAIENTQTVYVNLDFLKDYNTSNLAFANVGLDGSRSGIGFVDFVTINEGGTGYANGSFATFQGGSISIGSVEIQAAGTGYANGQHLIASGIGFGAVMSILTNATGGIVDVNIIEGGEWSDIPTLTVDNTLGPGTGQGAVLIAQFGNPSIAAVGTITTNANGTITLVNLTNQGEGYSSLPNLTISGAGSGANLTPVMNYGYGFIKNPYGDINSVINSTLRYGTITAGTIASLTGIAPGLQYNLNPFVQVHEPYVAGLDLRDYVVQLSNTQGSFAVGEAVEQNVESPAIELAYVGLTGNSAFDINDVISQGNTASGYVYYRDASVVRLTNVTGTFVDTANVATEITGNISDGVANVTSVSTITELATATGIIQAANSSQLSIRRTAIFNDFQVGQEIIGQTSGATSNLVSYTYNYDSPAIGNNASVSANVQTANGYGQDETVTLINPNNTFEMVGLAQLQQQGQGEGYWTSISGFLDYPQYIHDGVYYQLFSYEVQTSLSLDRYSDILKQMVHVAGTAMYGTAWFKPTVQFNSSVAATLTQAP
jgi:hypothetical protein